MRCQGTRCERNCNAMLSALLTLACPRRGTATHMRRTVTPRSMAKHRLAGSDQPLKGSNLISEATLNVLEAGGSREITGVEEERLHVCHEHISVTEEVAHLR